MGVDINITTSKPGYFAGETVEGTLTVSVVSGCLSLHDDGCPEKRDTVAWHLRAVDQNSTKKSKDSCCVDVSMESMDTIDISINYFLVDTYGCALIESLHMVGSFNWSTGVTSLALLGQPRETAVLAHDVLPFLEQADE